MASNALREETLNEVIRRIEDCLKDGFKPPSADGRHAGGAISEAARRAVKEQWVGTERAFTKRYEIAKARGIVPDWSLWRAPVYHSGEPIVYPLEAYPPIAALKPTGRPIKVCVIGDAHDDPRLPDKSRFRWMGQWARERDPDYIVQIGDWGTFDSLSRHNDPASLKARGQPSWAQDLASMGESVSAFHEGLGPSDAILIMTQGNHEDRAARYEDNHPDMRGTLVPAWQGLFTGMGWRIAPFGEYVHIDGVGFVHHPINPAGKAYGGKTGNQRAANDTVFSIVHGHDHKLERVSAAKIGYARPIEVISVGCSLPWGWVEPYAKISTEGWWWGVVELTIQDGTITDMNTVSMLRLEERYA